MAKQELITKLSSFFEQQTEDDAQIEDELTFAALINRTPNPGIALAKENLPSCKTVSFTKFKRIIRASR